MATKVEETAVANIRRLRTEQRVTQAELAAKTSALDAGVGENRIWGLENGRRQLKVTDLVVIAEALGTTPAGLLSDTPRDAGGSVAYSVCLGPTLVQTVVANRVETGGDGWVRFYRGEVEVFFAPAAQVLYVKIADGAEAPHA